MDDISTAVLAQITSAVPIVAGIIGGFVGLVFVFALGRYVYHRVRGTVR